MMKPGFYTNWTFEQYLKADALSRGKLVTFGEKSPAHSQVPVKVTRRMILGAAKHTAFFEPELFAPQYGIMPEDEATKGKTVAGKALSKQIKADGKIVLSWKEAGQIPQMVEAVRSDEDAGPLLARGIPEMSAIWQDVIGDLWCKCKPDWVTDNGVVPDLKTCDDASDHAFMRTFWAQRYDVQAWFYLRGLNAAAEQTKTKANYDLFCYIAAENNEPFGVRVYYPSKELLLSVMEEFEPHLERYAKCLETNIWPKYEKGPKMVEKPPWR